MLVARRSWRPRLRVVNKSCARIPRTSRRNIAVIPLPIKQHAFSMPKSSEATLYIKGFLGRGEHPDHFEDWQNSHCALIEKKNWSPIAYGYYWKSGDSPLPLPIATGVSVAWNAFSRTRYLRLTQPLTLAATLVADAAIYLGQLAYEYHKTASSIEENTAALSNVLLSLRHQYERLRVVSHSLGCKLLTRSISLLAPEERPDDIHLCAPALPASELEKVLPTMARNKTYIYYSPRDLVLDILYKYMSKDGEPAVGCAGLPSLENCVLSAKYTSFRNADSTVMALESPTSLPTCLPNSLVTHNLLHDKVEVINVDTYFQVSVHSAYRYKFHEFAR